MNTLLLCFVLVLFWVSLGFSGSAVLGFSGLLRRFLFVICVFVWLYSCIVSVDLFVCFRASIASGAPGTSSGRSKSSDIASFDPDTIVTCWS